MCEGQSIVPLKAKVDGFRVPSLLFLGSLETPTQFGMAVLHLNSRFDKLIKLRLFSLQQLTRQVTFVACSVADE